MKYMIPIVIFCKLVSLISKSFNLGAGATWPGEITLGLKPDILKNFASKLKKGTIIVAGTNGKTTTSLMIKKILEDNGETVIHNASGANLLNGVVSAFIENASWFGEIDADWGVFEVDENSLPVVLPFLQGHSERSEESSASASLDPSSRSKIGIQDDKRLIIVLLNLFRDQLDRYGEVDVIAEKWEKALRQQRKQDRQESKTGNQIQIIADADDPLIAHIANMSNSGNGRGVKNTYFGLNEPELFLGQMEHATDSTFCLNCGNRLTYQGIYYSHLGLWHCEKCGEKRPEPKLSKWESPLPGIYNLYNTLAAVSVAKDLKIRDKEINDSLKNFSPAFGRQEEFKIDGHTSSASGRTSLGASKTVKIFLSKNPAGFNESLRTVLSLGARNILLVLNDRIPDGRDVSWIWDVDFEKITEQDGTENAEPNGTMKIIVSGDRCFDLALRMKYAEISQKSNSKVKNGKNLGFITEPDLDKAIKLALSQTQKGKTLYILSTYSAMLEVRKILTGKKIL